jgi:hypothetical protein
MSSTDHDEEFEALMEENRELRRELAKKGIDDARDAYGHIARDWGDDPMGDVYLESAAQAIIDAQNEYLKQTDFDSYCEKRQMGLLSA